MNSGPWRVYAVLGMHRSGTSWLAPSLQARGRVLARQARLQPVDRRAAMKLWTVYNEYLVA